MKIRVKNTPNGKNNSKVASSSSSTTTTITINEKKRVISIPLLNVDFAVMPYEEQKALIIRFLRLLVDLPAGIIHLKKHNVNRGGILTEIYTITLHTYAEYLNFVSDTFTDKERIETIEKEHIYELTISPSNKESSQSSSYYEKYLYLADMMLAPRSITNPSILISLFMHPHVSEIILRYTAITDESTLEHLINYEKVVSKISTDVMELKNKQSVDRLIESLWKDQTRPYIFSVIAKINAPTLSELSKKTTEFVKYARGNLMVKMSSSVCLQHALKFIFDNHIIPEEFIKRPSSSIQDSIAIHLWLTRYKSILRLLVEEKALEYIGIDPKAQYENLNKFVKSLRKTLDKYLITQFVNDIVEAEKLINAVTDLQTLALFHPYTFNFEEFLPIDSTSGGILLGYYSLTDISSSSLSSSSSSSTATVGLTPFYYDYRKYPNYNMIVVGESGYGKSMFVKMYISRLLSVYDSALITIIDPTDEYSKLVNYFKDKAKNVEVINLTQQGGVGGEGKGIDLIDLDPFNFFEPEHAASILATVSGVTDVISKEFLATASRLKEKNKSVNIYDFYNELSDVAKQYITDLISAFKQFFPLKNEAHTTVDITQSLSTSSIKIISIRDIHLYQHYTVLLMLLLAKVFSMYMKLNEMKDMAKVVVLDEAWLLLKNEYTAKVIEHFVRIGRKYGIHFIMVTQMQSDISNDAMSIILNNSATKVFFKLESQEAQRLVQIMKLDQEKYLPIIINIGVGEALIIVDPPLRSNVMKISLLSNLQRYIRRLRIFLTHDEFKAFNTSPYG